jgi:hypothetical protein
MTGVERLDFKAERGDMPLGRCPQADAVIASGRDAELESQDEVGELFSREQIAPLLLIARDRSLGDDISINGPHPPI